MFRSFGRAKKRQKMSRASNAATLTGNTDVCFVIMPFGGWLDDYYETIYRPAIVAAGLEAHRADDLYRPSTIVNDIWTYTRRAKLLLADLTGKNPNVFYELGLAHALAKPAILVAESMDDIPFDLRALRIITYDKNDPKWGEILQQKVQAAIGEVLKAPQEAVLPAFLHVRESAGKVSVTPHEKELIEIKQEIDLLRREIRRGTTPPERGRPATVDIGPNEARARIERYLKQGFSDRQITRRLELLGPPEEWIRREIRHMKTRLRDGRTSAEEAQAVPANSVNTSPKVPNEP